MISYASIDRIENDIAICEIELIPFYDSYAEDYAIKETVINEVSLRMIEESIDEVEEGDIIVVQQEDGKVVYVFYKDEDEKERRIEVLNEMGY